MHRDKPSPSKHRQIYALSLGFLCYLLVFHFLVPVLLNYTGYADLINSGVVLILSSIFATVCCAGMIFYIFRVNVHLPDDMEKRNSTAWIISFFAVCLILDIGATGFNTLFRAPLTSFMKWFSNLAGTSEIASAPKMTQGDVAAVLYSVLFAPVLEELVFRGLFYAALRRYGRWLAIITSALMFGFMHMNIYQFVGAVLSGIIYAVLRDRAGLMMSVMLHIVTNWLNAFLVPLWLESRTYGRIYYMVLLVAMILSIVMVGLYFSKKNPYRDRNIAFLELDAGKRNRRMVLGNPVLLACFVLCVVFMVC